MTSTSSVCGLRSEERIGPPLQTPILKLAERTEQIAGKGHYILVLFDS